MSVEGGMKGMQQTFTCPRCGKSFTFWRPETQPGVKVKCYFCKNEFEDEAAKRAQPLAPPEPSEPPASAPPETPAT
jgi:transcription elongation factor Elf1